MVASVSIDDWLGMGLPVLISIFLFELKKFAGDIDEG